MIKLTIDQRIVEVPENTTVMEAAESAGIEIPAMCFMKGYSNHPSCMVCLVREQNSGNLFASCAMPVTEGMEVVTNDDEVREARKEALELLLSDHVGDCEAPCRNGCPAFMDIPRMNRLIAEGNYHDALVNVKEEIALPLILGYICEAPCEKVCRREPIDGAVSICHLKRFVAQQDLIGDTPFFPEKEKPTGKKVAIIGAGPAGLSASFYLVWKGYQCTVFDRNEKVGGSLLDLPSTILPPEALQAESAYLANFGVEFRMGQNVDAAVLKEKIKPAFDAVLLTTGVIDSQGNSLLGVDCDDKGFIVDKDHWVTTTPGIFAAGSAVRKQQMAVRVVAQGKAAALSIAAFLLGKKEDFQRRKLFNSRFGRLFPEEHMEYLKESTDKDRVIPAGGELSGFIPPEAVEEAKRCMHCDCRKPKTCKLRLYADEYAADRKKYLSAERKPVRKQFTHKSIVYEQEKCIKCGLCVEIAAKDKELTGLTFIGRGFDVRIGVPFSRELDAALTKAAEKCALACPTAAISFKYE